MRQDSTTKRRRRARSNAEPAVVDTTPPAGPAQPDDDELLTRPRAAALLSQCWGGIPVATRSLASWPIPYVLLGHCVLYRRADVVRHAMRKLDAAPLRSGGGVAAVRDA